MCVCLSELELATATTGCFVDIYFFILIQCGLACCKVFEKRKTALQERLAIWVKKRESLSRYVINLCQTGVIRRV